MTNPAERLAAALSDRYRIEHELGQGGMATVYLAEDIRHHRKVPSDPDPEMPESTPDGKSIIFKTHDAAGKATLWSIPSSGGPPRQLVRFTDPDRQSNRPEFATDGKRLFFTIDEKQSDVYVADLVRK